MLRDVFTLLCAVLMGWVHAGSDTVSLKPILEVLDGAKVSGSLEFSGPCERSLPELPLFRMLADAEGGPLPTLRKILVNNSAIQVTQEPNGTIRMVEAGVPTDFLNIKIRHISFDNHGAGPIAAHSPNVALRAILMTPEVVAFMRSRAIEWPFSGGGVGAEGTSIDQPQILGSLDNVTVSEALDHIAKTFGGIWVYESCAKTEKRNAMVYIRFYYLRKIDSDDVVLE